MSKTDPYAQLRSAPKIWNKVADDEIDDVIEEILDDLDENGYIQHERKEWWEWQTVDGRRRQVAVPTSAQDADGNWVWPHREAGTTPGADGILGTADDVTTGPAVAFTLPYTVNAALGDVAARIASYDGYGPDFRFYWGGCLFRALALRRMNPLVGSFGRWYRSGPTLESALDVFRQALEGETEDDFRVKWSWDPARVARIARNTPGTPEYIAHRRAQQGRGQWVKNRIAAYMKASGHDPFPPKGRGSKKMYRDFADARRAANDDWKAGAARIDPVGDVLTPALGQAA